MAKLTLEEWLARAEKDRRFMENVRAIRKIPARPGEFAAYPAWVHPPLRKVLAGRGIGAALQPPGKGRGSGPEGAERRPRHARRRAARPSATTSRSSRRSSKSRRPAPSTSFPTKALAQDQMHEVHGLIGEMKADIKTYTYDGDTPDDARQAIRRQGHVVVTNPDMLHAGILPHHTKWQKLFANLQYVVIDELHVYRGVFGSHLTNVLRRLVRICRFYGRDPVFICCSATVANPREHAERLLERPVALIDESGAPDGGQDLHPLQPAHRQPGAGHPPVRPDAGPEDGRGADRKRHPDDRLCHQPPERRGPDEVPEGSVRQGKARGHPVRHRLPRGIPPQPPPADRGGTAQPRGDGRRDDQRPGAGDRHRRSGGRRSSAAIPAPSPAPGSRRAGPAGARARAWPS